MDASVEIWEPVRSVTARCAEWAGAIHRKAYYAGCYIPALDRVILPTDWPSKRELQEIRVHEHAHRVFGWRHAVKIASY